MSIKKSIKELLALSYYNLYHRYKKPKGNRVLLYHSIGTKLKHDTYGISISKERFVEHMKYLKDNYKIIAIDDEYHNRLDEDTISITFDDGYKDNLYALEVCDKYDIDFTLYITTAEIGKDEYLSSDDIKVLDSSQRCIIGTHSVTHPHLDRLSYEEQYRELNESKKVLEDILCKSIYDMSYPHGSYNSDTLDIVQKLGYTRVGSSHIGINNKDSYNNLIIKRLEVVASDTTDKLKKMIDGYYDFL